MSELLNISNWSQRPWFSTGGTRAKRLLHNPSDDKIYYFKKSAEKFPYEFWSEVIAYELGKILQLNVLKYEVAVFENEIGCVSQSMIDADKEELIEGGKYLQAHYPEFSPEDKKLRTQYTFQLIEDALTAYKLQHFMNNILEIVVFDALIGNSDRHQENWAFISNYNTLSKALKELEGSIRSGNIKNEPKWFQSIIGILTNKKGNETTVFKPEINKMKLGSKTEIKFAPIYDSGSSLCRECTPEKIDRMLNDKIEFDAYLNRASAEIHWNSQKLTHFELISNILETIHGSKMRQIISKVVGKFDSQVFKKALVNIDIAITEPFSSVKLSQNRKDLILNLVSLRAQKLKEIIKR